jgi:hypothetical protein
MPNTFEWVFLSPPVSWLMHLALLLLQAPFGLGPNGSGEMALMFMFLVIGQNLIEKNKGGMAVIGNEQEEAIYG